jgi:competence ComEA-like helix-hairpin-helix protein
LRFSRNEIRVLVLLTIVFLANLAVRQWQIRNQTKRPISVEEKAFEAEFLRKAREKHAGIKRQPASVSTQRIDLNTAISRDLVTLPGIGPKTAAAILAWRKRHGGFKNVRELLLVKGIGEKKFQAIEKYVRCLPVKSKASYSERRKIK